MTYPTRPGESAWTPTQHARHGEVDVAFDRLAGADGMPLLLVMGLATSRFWWPTGLCEAFAAEGFAVARYDQRDAGESTRMPDVAGSNPFAALLRKKGEAYTAEDMTDDAIAVLDELGWPQAHVFGALPGRSASPSGSPCATPTACGPSCPPRRCRATCPASASRATCASASWRGSLGPRFPEGREGDLQASLAVARGVASPGYPFDEDAAREWIEREVDSGPRDTKAQSRQIGAQWHGPRLRDLRAPALVLHGEADPILRVSAARATANAIDGARLVTFPGVGHDLPAPLWPTVAREVGDLARRAEAAVV